MHDENLYKIIDNFTDQVWKHISIIKVVFYIILISIITYLFRDYIKYIFDNFKLIIHNPANLILMRITFLNIANNLRLSIFFIVLICLIVNYVVSIMLLDAYDNKSSLSLRTLLECLKGHFVDVILLSLFTLSLFIFQSGSIWINLLKLMVTLILIYYSAFAILILDNEHCLSASKALTLSFKFPKSYKWMLLKANVHYSLKIYVAIVFTLLAILLIQYRFALGILLLIISLFSLFYYLIKYGVYRKVSLIIIYRKQSSTKMHK